MDLMLGNAMVLNTHEMERRERICVKKQRKGDFYGFIRNINESSKAEDHSPPDVNHKWGAGAGTKWPLFTS